MNNMKKFWMLIFLLAMANAQLMAQPSFISDSLDTYVKREMQRWQVPGLAVAIVKDGKIILEKGYGVCDVKTQEPVNEHTLFMVASNSKAFTGTALANLAFQKRLSLNDPIVKLLPYFKMKDDYLTTNITIEDMLSHRIGFETFQSDFLNWDCIKSRKDLISNMRNSDPIYDFRTKYGYCNVCFLSAGEVIPAVTDTTWDDYLMHHFFKPLEMNRTSSTNAELIKSENKAQPYTIVDHQLYLLKYANIDNIGPAASLNSSVHDLSHWLMMQLDYGKFNGKEIFPKEVIADTWKSRTIVQDRNGKDGRNFMTYGLGWFMYDLHGKRIITHDGGANGFVTTTCFVPSEKLGVIVLTNSDANSLYSTLRNQIVNAYLETPYENYSENAYKRYTENITKHAEEIKALKDESAAIKKWEIQASDFVGAYHNEVYGSMTIKQTGKKLIAYFENHPSLSAELTPLKDQKLLAIYNDPTYGVQVFDILLDAQKKVESLTVRVNDFIEFLPYSFKKK